MDDEIGRGQGQGDNVDQVSGQERATPAASPSPVAFVDASAIVALVDRDDTAHDAAVTAYSQLVAAGYRLFTTNYVMAETFDLLTTGVGTAVARQWLKDSKLAIYHADAQDERSARRLIFQLPDDRQLSLTDAISLAVMDRLGVTEAFAVDPSFLATTD